MTRAYEPDGLLASVLATLSFDDTVVIFNGPCGCYNLISGTANRLIPKERNCKVDNRMECDFIENEDFIMGTVAKVDRALDSMKDSDYGLIAVIDSPGVSITGDVSWRYGSRNDSELLHMESLLSIRDFSEGYDTAVSQIVGSYRKGSRDVARSPSVNILGCCPSFLGWKDSVQELASLLGDAGISVASTPGCGGSFEDLGLAFGADLNVPVVPEYCRRTCEAISGSGGPETLSTSFVPIGFSGTARWVEEICEELGADPEAPLARIAERRRDASRTIRSAYHRDGFESKPFSVESVPSIDASLTSWMEDYLGMVRDDSDPEVVYGTGYSARNSDDPVRRRNTVVMEFPLPPTTYFIPRQTFGCAGASYLLEETFARYRSQPSVLVRKGGVGHHVGALGELHHLAADPVDLLEHLGRDDLLRRPYGVDLPRRPQHDHPIGVLRRDVEVVADHYDRLPGAVRDALQHLRDVELVADVQVGRRLVQYQGFGVLGYPSGDGDLLVLPCRELFELAHGQGLYPHELHDAVRLPYVICARLPVMAVVHPHQDGVEDGHREHVRGPGGNEAHHPRQLFGGDALDVAPVHQHPAGRRLEELQHALYQRGLSDAVRADDAVQPRLVEGQVNPIEDGDVPVSEA
ncbi:MAG: hypothetical protein IKQ60_05615 [Candidatus Methanomethylophilaceae archaeon]|nr:hypothetical protein [Candidatus Methanomethylophilaceae archaeon]MBR6204513.1 hypothetical protein [Candidatus Methanomethylophilaceae archaeon]